MRHATTGIASVMLLLSACAANTKPASVSELNPVGRYELLMTLDGTRQRFHLEIIRNQEGKLRGLLLGDLERRIATGPATINDGAIRVTAKSEGEDITLVLDFDTPDRLRGIIEIVASTGPFRVGAGTVDGLRLPNRPWHTF